VQVRAVVAAQDYALTVPNLNPDLIGQTKFNLLFTFILALRSGESGEGPGSHQALSPLLVWGAHSSCGYFLEQVFSHAKHHKVSLSVAAAAVSGSGLKILQAWHDHREEIQSPVANAIMEGEPASRGDYFTVSLWLHNCRNAAAARQLTAKAISKLSSFNMRLSREPLWVATQTIQRAARKYNSAHRHQRYTNLAGGPEEQCARMVEHLHRAGLPVRLIPGPLFRHRYRGVWTANPASSQSLAKRRRKLLEHGYKMANLTPQGELSGHASRRGASAAAEAALSRGTTRATEKDTKFHFKWSLKELMKDMQNYYAGLRPLLQRVQVSLGI
jgi:hypothetical protein